jgi:cytochrome P450
MRLFPPVVTVPKSTGFSSANINYNGKVYTVPPETNVDLMVSAMGYRQEYWGPDAHDFAPERWDARNKASFLAQNDNVEGLAAPGLEYPTVHKPVRGAFIPFSDGHRACLGKKFAQVEYVAIMALILREFEISLAKVSPDESDESAVKRARKALDESSMVLSLAMAGDVPLSFRQSRI